MGKITETSRTPRQPLPDNTGGSKDERFLDIASELRRTLEEAPDEFLAAASRLGVDRRKAYYLIEIDRSLDGLKVDRQRLARIGWTKLQIIAGYIDARNAENLFGLAERHATHELARLVKYEPVDPDARKNTVLLYFTETEYDLFRRVVLAHGATVSGKGIAGKEQALIAALKKLDK